MSRAGWKTGFWIFLVLASTSGYGYQTLKTPHFYIHSPKEVPYEVVLDLGQWAEGAYSTLEKLFGYSVGEVHIEVHSQGDVPNGNASNISFNKINYYTAAADYDSEIGFRNWAQSLMIHELSHIFENDAHRGYASVLRAIFGKPPVNPLNTSMIDPFYLVTAQALPPMLTPFFTAPNLTTPTWFDEGTAVFSESFFASDGRLNSNEYHTRYRENVLFGFAPMSQFAAYNTLSTPYAYGAGIFYEIYETLGYRENFTGELAMIHAGRFYFAFDGGISTLMEQRSIEGASDYSYSKLYENFQRRETERQKKDLEKLATRPVTHPELLMDLGKTREDVKGMTLSPDGKRIYFSTDSDLKWDYFGSYSRDRIYVYDLEKKERKEILSGYFTGNRLEMGASGKYLYTHIYEKKQALVYALPVRINLEKGSLEIIDKELTRFYDIAPSSDESKIVGIQIEASGNKKLVLYHLASRKVVILAEQMKGIKPVFVSDHEVAYLEYDFETRKTQLIQIDTQTLEEKVLTEFNGKVRQPFLKNQVLYFSADGNGVYNLYAYHLQEKTLKILTNVLSKAFFPLQAQNRIYYIQGGVNGHELSSLKMEEIPNILDLAQIGGERIASHPYEKALFNNPKFQEYHFYHYLKPSWWLPYLKYQRFTDYSQWNLGAFSSWNDPLDEHYLFLMANYDLHTKEINYLASYEYTGKNGFLAQAMALREQRLAKGEGIDDFYNEALAGWGFYTFQYSLTLKGGGFWDYRKSLEIDTPNQTLYGMLIQAEFSNRDFYRESFRKSGGVSLGLEYRKYLDPSFNEITGKMNFSLSGILSEKAVLSFLNQTGGVFGSYVEEQQVQYYTLLGSRFFEGYKNFPLDEYYGDQALLRGYTQDQVGGNYYLSGSVEYLFPLLEMVGGYESLPFYLRGIYVSAFWDYALTSNESYVDLKNQKILYSYGGELGVSTLLFYESSVDFLIGYARNVEYQSDLFYFTVKIPFGREADLKNTGISNQEFYGNLKKLN